jgi:hypothetical protein
MTETDIPRYEIAERALDSIRREIDQWRNSGKSQMSLLVEIAHILDIADARLRMASLRRDRRRPRWFAKVTSGVYGRGFMGPGEFGKDPDPHLCFTVEITDGTKAARGARVEVQAPDAEMEFLAMQIHNMVELRQRLKAEEGGS